jgi:hypothetical protein
MKMRSMLFWAVVLVLMLAVVGCATQETASEEGLRKDVLYVCDCGPECDCNTVSTEPGDCKCGKPMKWHHLLKVEGNEALLCTCNEGCKCDLDEKDPTKCGCGSPVKRVSLEGTGVFFCNCGGSCKCNEASATAGECGCGMQLKQAN